jgi:hypothetical protein
MEPHKIKTLAKIWESKTKGSPNKELTYLGEFWAIFEKTCMIWSIFFRNQCALTAKIFAQCGPTATQSKKLVLCHETQPMSHWQKTRT